MDLLKLEREQTDGVRVGPYRDKLIKVLYPEIYGKLTRIGALLQDMIESEPQMALLQSIQMKMRSELDELCRQEDELIFPLLLQLEQEERKADNCKSFKTVKFHYTQLISMLQQFKALLLQLAGNSEEPGALMLLNDKVADFEALLIKVQINKEQTVFKQFRNCNNGCKAL